MHERRITIQEIYAAYLAGEVEEVFGTGTAAIITPIGELKWEGKQIIINNGEIGELSLKIYNTITGIQIGKEKDAFNWIIEI